MNEFVWCSDLIVEHDVFMTTIPIRLIHRPSVLFAWVSFRFHSKLHIYYSIHRYSNREYWNFGRVNPMLSCRFNVDKYNVSDIKHVNRYFCFRNHYLIVYELKP